MLTGKADSSAPRNANSAPGFRSEMEGLAKRRYRLNWWVGSAHRPVVV